MSTREQPVLRKPLKLRLGPNPESMGVTAMAVNNKEDKENVVPESARCYLESIEYICGHRLDLSPAIHINCKGIPANQRQCNNMAALPQILNSGRECSKCAVLKANESDEAAKASVGSNIPTPTPAPAPVTPPSNMRGSIHYRSSSSHDIIRSRSVKLRLTFGQVLREAAAKAEDKLEADASEEGWETISKKEVEGMADSISTWYQLDLLYDDTTTANTILAETLSFASPPIFPDVPLSLIVGENKEDKETEMPKSDKCYTTSIQYSCGHITDLHYITHIDCKGVPPGKPHCGNVAPTPKVMFSERKCYDCNNPKPTLNTKAARKTWAEKVDAQASILSLPSVPTRDPSKVVVKSEDEMKGEGIREDSWVDVGLETEVEAEEGWLLAS
ncbi:hypothetical protein BDZ45DRAFT_737898 [Acephala macrosclerotiorum]|nr:hypothetical protein BDZ45DRAFT_737898 [Acephala macrosclerotiorum]